MEPVPSTTVEAPKVLPVVRVLVLAVSIGPRLVGTRLGRLEVVLSERTSEQPCPRQGQLLELDGTEVTPGVKAVLSTELVRDSRMDRVGATDVGKVKSEDRDAEMEHSDP